MKKPENNILAFGGFDPQNAIRQAQQWGELSAHKQVYPVFMISTNALQQTELFTCYSDLSVIKPILQKAIQIIEDYEKQSNIRKS